MTLADDLFYHTEHYSHKVLSLYQPLVSPFLVANVAFFHVSHQGQMVNIHTHPGWMTHCLANNYHLNDPHMTHPSKMGTGIILSEQHLEPEFQGGLHADGPKFGHLGNVSFAKKTASGYLALTFHLSTSARAAEIKMLQNYSHLLQFSEYLEDELKPVFGKLQDRTIDVMSLSCKTGIIKPDDPEMVLMQAKLGFFEGVKGRLELTKRQRNMLGLYLSGMDIEQIAFKHGTSARLVESRLEAVKQHLDCDELHKYPFLADYATEG